METIDFVQMITTFLPQQYLLLDQSKIVINSEELANALVDDDSYGCLVEAMQNRTLASRVWWHLMLDDAVTSATFKIIIGLIRLSFVDAHMASLVPADSDLWRRLLTPKNIAKLQNIGTFVEDLSFNPSYKTLLQALRPLTHCAELIAAKDYSAIIDFYAQWTTVLNAADIAQLHASLLIVMNDFDFCQRFLHRNALVIDDSFFFQIARNHSNEIDVIADVCYEQFRLALPERPQLMVRMLYLSPRGASSIVGRQLYADDATLERYLREITAPSTLTLAEWLECDLRFVVDYSRWSATCQAVADSSNAESEIRLVVMWRLIGDMLKYSTHSKNQRNRLTEITEQIREYLKKHSTVLRPFYRRHQAFFNRRIKPTKNNIVV